VFSWFYRYRAMIARLLLSLIPVFSTAEMYTDDFGLVMFWIVSFMSSCRFTFSSPRVGILHVKCIHQAVRFSG
jgi:hypothetical protein